MLKKRTITVLLVLPLLIAAIWFDEPLPWFTIFVAIWALGAAFEFFTITGAIKTIFLTVFGMVWTLLFIISPHFHYSFILPLLLASAVIISLVGLLFQPHKEGGFVRWVWMMGGILYIGWLMSYFIALRGLTDGRGWVLLALLTIFACDTTAFFVGRAWGKHRLAPDISPQKTWEGAAGGTLGAIAASIIVVAILKLPIGYGQAAVLGLLMSVFGQLGDLVESLLKRNTGVKDSGKLMPGHGGILDRTDSIVFTGVIAYYYILWVVL